MPKVPSLDVTDGGRRLHPAVATALTDIAPDLVTLQGNRADTVADWRRSLERAGFHVYDTLELARRHGLPPQPLPFRRPHDHQPRAGGYRYGHVCASREFRRVTCDSPHEFRLDGNHHAAILAGLAGA